MVGESPQRYKSGTINNNVGMEAFNQGTIDRIDLLFGREDTIKTLMIYSKRRESVNLVGARRSGKTCILQTLSSTIKDTLPDVYPLYIDVKDSGITSDTDAAYRYFLAQLVSSLNRDGYYCDQELALSGVCFKTSELYEDIFDNPILTTVSGAKIQSMFQCLIGKINNELAKSVLILFDEYEVLLKYTFSEPVGFYKLRTIADSNRYKFSFIVAGHEKWDRLITDLGSGELNGIVAEEDVYPISRDAFSQMWRYECSLIEDADIAEKIRAEEDFAYVKSGGVPFYAKIIGSFMLVRGKRPDYSVISFEELLQSLSYEEKVTLSKLCFGETIKDSPYSASLVAKGVITGGNDSYSVTIGFLKDYFESHKLDAQLKADFKLPCEKLAEEIADLIKTINYNHKQNGNDYVFELANDSETLFMDMGRLAVDEDQFTLFSIAIYKTVFQRTAAEETDARGNRKNVSKKRLPRSWKETDFVKTVDIFRHSFGQGHEMDGFIQGPNAISLEAALKRYQEKGRPYESHEWISLQLKVLEEFVAELKVLLAKVNSGDWT